ncbi:hypothetical protein HYDPIDRAFT_26799 [Hydnomerulius pinastri MD-312]|nr:hypothetical protein HYDPIDRAFT_26799 [Hydnomerulius pinastri MD-312]
MRFPSISFVFLALVWSAALGVRSAPAVDQGSQLVGARSLEARDPLEVLLNQLAALLGSLLTALPANPTTSALQQQMEGLTNVTKGLPLPALPIRALLSSLPSTSATANHTTTTSRALEAAAVKTTTSTSTGTSSSTTSTSKLPLVPKMRRQIPALPLPLPLPLSLPLPLPLPLSDVPPAAAAPPAQSSGPSSVSRSASRLSSTASASHTAV